MEQIVQQITQALTNDKTILIICSCFIISDIALKLLYCWKTGCYSSTKLREGMTKKASWYIMMLLGFAIHYFIDINIVLMLVATTCIMTEFISIIENLHELGIDFNFTQKIESNEVGGKDEQ